MPEFDTYHILERYAKANNDKAAFQAYIMLKRRTQLSVMWRSLCAFGAEHLDEVSRAQLGAFAEESKRKTATDLGSMKEEERRDFFMKAMEMTGVQLDPAVLAEINKQEVK